MDGQFRDLHGSVHRNAATEHAGRPEVARTAFRRLNRDFYARKMGPSNLLFETGTLPAHPPFLDGLGEVGYFAEILGLYWGGAREKNYHPSSPSGL